ncbi:MAG: PIN domain-containing protein [Chloroflexota bacterium]|nr:PIN domain-containing protein [Chloroflexota bacterium]
MNTLTIVDTDILIDTARQVSVAVSVIIQLRHTESFLQRFQVLKLNERISDAAADLLRQYRLSHGLAIPDALIAATAIALNRPLISKNQRDYHFISRLQLLPYP